MDNSLLIFETKKDNTCVLKKYKGKEKIVSIPKEYEGFVVSKIGIKCFEKNKFVEEVIIPESIKIIGKSAFYSCENLRKINLQNVEIIDDCAFLNSGVEEIYLNKIKKIEAWSFKSCQNLQKVEIDNDMDMIEFCTFKDCKKLEYIKLPNYLKIIKSNAFDNCENLSTIIWPKKIEKIEQDSFLGCNKIKNIDLSSDTNISELAFEKNVFELMKKYEKEDNDIVYNFDFLLNKTKDMNNNEIEKYIMHLLKEHKLDDFDVSNIIDMNNIGFNKDSGEITWKCPRCGYCTLYLWDLLAENGKILDKFDISGCGFCE